MGATEGTEAEASAARLGPQEWSAFDRGVAAEPAGDGRYRATVDPRWNIANAPNGGYLLSIALSAVAAELPHPDPFAVSAHYPSRTEPGPADVSVEVVRLGRGSSTARAILSQEGTARALVTATFGDLDAMRGPTSIQTERPEFPPPDDCVRAVGPHAPAFLQQFDLRLTPETAAWAVTGPSGVAEAAGWNRFADGREPDAACLPLMSDSFPPTIFNVLPAAWVPTIELTVHVRGRPIPGWLQCRFRTRYLIDGYLEEDGEIWDSTGRLVALSRQMARVL
jgi:acyl-CoA thioesterase